MRSETLRPRVWAFGEAAWMVEVGRGIDAIANGLAQALATAVREDVEAGWGDPIAAYDSVLVPFDPERQDAAVAERRLIRLAEAIAATPPALATGRTHHVPVRYGAADGPDLEVVAERLGCTPAQVVELHASASYRVFMLGFSPGFAYLGTLPDRLRLPRRDEPRPRVPAGSVAVAGAQTAVYPSSTPGGWHLIGRTDMVIWDVSRTEPALFLPGDSVRFEPVRD